MEKKFNDLATEYGVGARKYFYILRLAIYHIDGVATDTSLEVSRYDKSTEVYRCACNILNALYK